jgi:hypothetical protein
VDEAEEMGYALPKEKRGDEDEEEVEDKDALVEAPEPPEDGGVAMEEVRGG